ncbi:hypothetical protein EYF80_065411 [Liparis tanakae]|uniref:Uncharacterized protein n=1 Tax=Liparis tanakae TaxID=230148 RepID=A0A4Z2E739_9TELE|nr:hypothetical protein EYF80_065411 [Liparis tanakae]
MSCVPTSRTTDWTDAVFPLLQHQFPVPPGCGLRDGPGPPSRTGEEPLGEPGEGGHDQVRFRF